MCFLGDDLCGAPDLLCGDLTAALSGVGWLECLLGGILHILSSQLKYVYAWNPRCPLGRRHFASTLPGLFTDPLLLLPVPVAEIQNGAPVPLVGEPGRLAG
ncbi:hypothetical protein NDU88_004376 [Pleurodeles waltl]|uniref:Uncharacterized protein n=1 Tax=Pleurodeles waltl TaxID=8319 RepID=A0AAV7V0Z5_PLEWA|nr:hypothetical protein NDU88_004376 [Pleurodeles waltl]